jgi:hypothetical protein
MKRSAKLPRIIELADRAIRKAVRQVMIEHKEKRLPIFVWQHNKVVRIPAHRISTR